MNFEDGKQFVRELLIAFPAFDDAARNSPDIAATHRSWLAAWDDLTFAECSQVLQGLIKRAEISYDDYRAPGSFIRRLVMARRKNTPKSEEELVNERQGRLTRNRNKRDYSGSPMSLALAHAHELKNIGVPKETIFEEMDFIIQFGNVPKHSEKFKAGRVGT